MATGLTNQAAAASDPAFLAMVKAGICQTAVSVYNEATTLSANLGTVAVTSLPVTPALSATLAAGPLLVGDTDTFITAGASSGVTSVPVTSLAPSKDWPAGTVVSPPTPNGHTARKEFAGKVLLNPDFYANLFVWVLAAESIDKSSGDAAILNEISAVWNAMAGA